MQHINRHLSTINTDEWSMKVAFASSDCRHVDHHFGATPRLVVYGVKQDDVTLLRVIEFTVQPGHKEDKLACRMEALNDCITLYCVALGESVFHQLLQIGVRAVRVPEGTPVAELLAQTQRFWRDNDRRANRRKRDPARFQHLLKETCWQEENEPEKR
nr:NifB/NifX family molybdenum-iron cluster-binding protein [uncultured Enterobacter sp.]